MADDKPVQTPAPNDDGNKPDDKNPTPPAPSSGPEGKPAENKPAENPTPPANPLDSLSDEDKAYLKGQGITDLSSPEAVQKVINHARSSQKTASEKQAQLDRIQGAVNPSPEPQNPLTTPPQTPSQTDSGAQTPAPSNQPQVLSEMEAFTLTNQLVTSYPKLEEGLKSGQLYNDMKAEGVPLHTPDGKVNLTGILNYAKYRNDKAELEAKIAEAKPGEDAIPNADSGSQNAPQQPAADAPMDAKMARAIVTQDTSHPRFNEAKDFLATNIGAKKS